MEIDRKIALYQKQGWCPVKWAHHPQPIKDALRDTGIRPVMKGCFVNTQRLMISRHPIVERLTYHEGYVITLIPMQHAWLTFDGERLDLTLEPGRDEVEYLDSHTYTVEQIQVALLRHRCFGPIDDRRLCELDPFRKQWETLQRLQEVANE